MYFFVIGLILGREIEVGWGGGCGLGFLVIVFRVGGFFILL